MKQESNNFGTLLIFHYYDKKKYYNMIKKKYYNLIWRWFVN